MAVAVLVLLSACQAPPVEMTEAEIAQIEAEVEAATNEWWEVWSAFEDFDRFMTFVADEPETLWIADAVPTFGKAAIDANFRPVQDAFQRQDNTRVEWRTIVLARDVAYTVRINDCFQIDLEGNPGPTVRYAETMVWVKRDGEWKVLIGHGSTPNESM
jgi:ketosteroid isomerase-like protein